VTRPWMPPHRTPHGDEPAGGPRSGPPEPAGRTARSVFAGRVVFTAHDPGSALRLRGLIDAVAIMPWAGWQDTLAVRALHEAGFRVLVWEADPTLGQAAVDAFDAAGWIAQSEGPGQHDAALRVGEGVRVPKALVTNLHAKTNPWPAGYYCFPEAYLTVNPQAEPATVYGDAHARGAREISPVFEFSENNVRVPLGRYLDLWRNPTGWAGYLAEQLDDADVATLRAIS
jgi:hypothetical protein